MKISWWKLPSVFSKEIAEIQKSVSPLSWFGVLAVSMIFVVEAVSRTRSCDPLIMVKHQFSSWGLENLFSSAATQGNIFVADTLTVPETRVN